MNEVFEQIKNTIIDGKVKEIESLVQQAVDDGLPLEALINDALIEAMSVVGRRFSSHEIFVPEMLVSAVTMKKGLEVVKPLIADTDAVSKGTVMICTVKGDIHDIGKNLVVMMLEGAGFKVIDLGVDITVENVVRQVQEVKPDVLGLSALLTTTMPEMEKVIESLTTAGLRDQVKVVVGGAPLDSEFAEKIGADGYGENAAEAVELCKKFTVAA
jgi:corrinoid protein of di/trimethylamine methyltransferase